MTAFPLVISLFWEISRGNGAGHILGPAVHSTISTTIVLAGTAPE